MSVAVYEYFAAKSILKALDIHVDVSIGEKPGDVIITVYNAPANIEQKLYHYLNDNETRPLTDRIILRMIGKNEDKMEKS